MAKDNGLRGAQTGGIGIRIVFAALTLFVIGAAIAFMLMRSQERQQENHRKAEQISLYGLQSALEKLGKDPSWDGRLDKVSYDGGWYSVSLRRFKTSDTLMLELQSEGSLEKASYTTSGLFAWSDSAWVPRGMR